MSPFTGIPTDAAARAVPFLITSEDWPAQVLVRVKPLSSHREDSAVLVHFQAGFDVPSAAAMAHYHACVAALQEVHAASPQAAAEFTKYHGNAVVYKPVSNPMSVTAGFEEAATAAALLIMPGYKFLRSWSSDNGEGREFIVLMVTEEQANE